MAYEELLCECVRVGVTCTVCVRLRPSGGLLGHTAAAVQRQDGVFGQRLLGRVLRLAAAAARLTEQVQVSLARGPAAPSSCWGLCRGAGGVTGARLEGDREEPG